MSLVVLKNDFMSESMVAKMSSTWNGDKLSLTILGVSHGSEIGMTLEGLPAGFAIDFNDLQQFLARRSPSKHVWSTTRIEPDIPEFLSGLDGAKTDGTIIKAIIKNTDVRSSNYENTKTVPRPGHADFPAYVKYNGQLNMAGGGPFSGRLTASLCVAGGIACQILASKGIFVGAHISWIGGIFDEEFCPVTIKKDLLAAVAKKDFPVVDDEVGEVMKSLITEVRVDGDSIGGEIECAVVGLPVGLGGALFDGLESRMASLVFGIPGVKGIEFGTGFDVVTMRGSENNDEYCFDNGRVVTKTNRSGGVLGGMTTGMPLMFNVAIKPTSSIAKPQNSVDLVTGELVVLEIEGRHDPCIVPRAVPCVEAVAAICVLDLLLVSEMFFGNE